METDSRPEPTEFQRRNRSFLYRVVMDTVQCVGRFVERLNPGLVYWTCFAILVALYVYMYFTMPWDLFFYVMVDTLVFLSLPLLIGVFTWAVANIRDFLDQLDPGDELHEWQGRRYYEFVRATRMRRAAPYYDVREDDDQSEEET